MTTAASRTLSQAPAASMLLQPVSVRNRSHNDQASQSQIANTDVIRPRSVKQSAPQSSAPLARKQASQTPYAGSSRHKSVTNNPSQDSQNVQKRPREEEGENLDDESMSDTEVTANVIAERRALGKKGRPKAVPGERNKNMRLSKTGLGGAEVYESLMTLVCAELVRRRFVL